MVDAAKRFRPAYEAIADSADPESWHGYRGKLITASRIPAILGLNPHRSALEQWMIDTGQWGDDDDYSEAAEWGLRLEPVIRRAYEDRSNRKTSPGGLLLRSTVYPWLGATLDAWAEIDGVWVPLEMKTCGVFRAEDWEEGVPGYYVPQVQAQMIVTDTNTASVAVLIGGQRMLIHDVERDEGMCERIIAETREHKRRIDEWEPPPPDGSDSAERAILKLYPEEDEGKTIMLDDEAVQLSERLDEVQRELSGLEKEKKALRQQIEYRIGDAERALLPGAERCWAWKTQHKKEFTVPAKTTRVLRKVKVK